MLAPSARSQREADYSYYLRSDTSLSCEVEISVLGVTTVSTVYFFADASINKNVLGRVGWLDRVRLGLVDHDTTMYLAPYDTE
jgi:hypothetical protein